MSWATALAAALMALVALRNTDTFQVSREKRSIMRARRRLRIMIWVGAAVGLGLLIGHEDNVLSGLSVAMLVVATGITDVGMAPESRRSVARADAAQQSVPETELVR